MSCVFIVAIKLSHNICHLLILSIKYSVDIYTTVSNNDTAMDGV